MMSTRRKRPGEPFASPGGPSVPNVTPSYAVTTGIPVPGPSTTVHTPTRPFNATSLQGEWDLNLMASQSMNDHLEALGVTEMARLAADKLDIGVKVDFAPGFVILIHESLLGEKTRKLSVDGETVDAMNNGMEATYMLNVESRASFRVTARWPMGAIIDTRTLEENGLVMKQVIQLTTTSGHTITTVRYYNRR